MPLSDPPSIISEGREEPDDLHIHVDPPRNITLNPSLDASPASGYSEKREILTEKDYVPSPRRHHHDGGDEQQEQQQQDEVGFVKAQMESARRGDQKNGIPPRQLGVTWDNLTVRALATESTLHENVGSQFNIPKLAAESHRAEKPLKTVIAQSHGCVKPGEMLLVLGRPGSGCSELLSVLANRRKGFASVSGDVHYGSMSAEEARRGRYEGQIVINTEEEVFFPSLTVGQTMDFATRLKVPNTSRNPEQRRVEERDFLLQALGIEHTKGTKVGNEFIRGVSGGERKRVSILEVMATRGSVFCWDNSTRGLDASTALEWAKCIRVMTDVLGLSTIATLYQAGNGIYDLFDKVLVLDHGREIFYGPAKQAEPFMNALGFLRRDGANVSDYLTGVTVPTERQVKPECERSFPRTAAQLQREYELSPVFKEMVAEYDYPFSREARRRTLMFQEAVAQESAPSKLLGSRDTKGRSPFLVGFGAQVKACVARQYQVMWGDRATILLTQASSLVQALIAGSLFYNAADDSSGLFIKGGAVFFAVLFNGLVAMSEVTNSFVGRGVVTKHKGMAFHHTAAYCIAQVMADIPILLLQVSLFSLVLYFMVGLNTTAAGFFTFWVVIFAVTMTMTAFFRALGSLFKTFDGASKVSGFAISAYAMYAGYMIAKPQMHPWFVWIYWINPWSYAVEALMASEFRDTVVPCVERNLIPSGPSYTDSAHQSCAGVGGAPPGQTSLTGEQYLASLEFSSGHIYRNLGILWGWWAFFVFVTVLATSRWKNAAESGVSRVVPREKAKKAGALLDAARGDEESQMGTHEVDDDFSTKDGDSVYHEHGGLGDRHNGDDVHTDDGEDDVDAITPVLEGQTSFDTESSGQRSRATSHAMSRSNNNGGGGDGQLIRNKSVFTWKNLTYTVSTPSGPRVLLDNVQGWVKPGMLGALMGASGAGKTTLLDVLAQRKTEGTIKGSILVDGKPLPVSFQRSAGYCEQLDVHEPYATVREALEFSALLRQSRDTPRAEKLAYVDTVLDLLELHDLADTLIGRVGQGLTVEQRKRVTIGVELVAKPSILIFLDEPTSGLDGQSAFSTVQFLRRLADAGQAVLVTIHQPSAQLFAQFDTLLLLAKGGKTVYFGEIGDNAATLKDYFARNGAPCPEDANPAEHMIDVVSANSAVSRGRDWNKVWLSSPEHRVVSKSLSRMTSKSASRSSHNVSGDKNEGEFATSLWTQTMEVTNRMNVSLWRNTDYINNKLTLHAFSALFNGFTFWMIGDGVGDLQQGLFTIFNFIFVAPGVMAQVQPLFLDRRDIFEAREKKAKMYSWIAFVTGLIVSEIPYLVVCAALYYVCWYYTVGFPADPSRSGPTFFVMLMYEFVYTGIAQFVAAYAPNAVFASLVNPLLIGVLVSFCGVLVPYAQLNVFWRSWLYWLNPFNYLMGSMLVFALWDTPVNCSPSELAVFDPPNGTSCRDYLRDYQMGPGAASNLLNPDATSACQLCQFRDGSDYLKTLNLNDWSYGWRDAGIVCGFVGSSYILVYLLMKLRTKTSKKAE